MCHVSHTSTYAIISPLLVPFPPVFARRVAHTQSRPCPSVAWASCTGGAPGNCESGDGEETASFMYRTMHTAIIVYFDGRGDGGIGGDADDGGDGGDDEMIRTSDGYGNDGQGEDDQDYADDEKRCVDNRQVEANVSAVFGCRLID